MGNPEKNGTVGVTKSGAQSTLSLDEEAYVVNHLEFMAACGYGFGRTEIIDLATVYAISLNKTVCAHPLCQTWYTNFMQRWPELKLRKPRSLELHPANAIRRTAYTW